jgi:plasmid stabilization system protein ParE
MRRVAWSESAHRQVSDYIDYLREVAPHVALRAAKEIFEEAERASVRPFGPRMSRRWPGLREISLHRWHKILVYRVEDERIVVAGVYDTRQDLSKVDPSSG